MQGSKLIITLTIIFIGSVNVHAQQSRKVTKSRSHYVSPKVRGNKAKVVCPTFNNSGYPLHALGVKFGDPFALTYKFYPNRRFSFALDLGKAASGLYNEYFRDKFDFYLMPDTFPSNESAMVYISHRVKSDFVAEAKILFHVDGEQIARGLQGYAGAGWEWKRTQLRYEYEYTRAYGDAASDPFGVFDRTRVTMGPQVVLGIEYAYFTIPVSAFMEAEYFTDVQADPGWQRFEGGVGLRYIFR